MFIKAVICGVLLRYKNVLKSRDGRDPRLKAAGFFFFRPEKRRKQ